MKGMDRSRDEAVIPNPGWPVPPLIVSDPIAPRRFTEIAIAAETQLQSPVANASRGASEHSPDRGWEIDAGHFR